MRYLLAVVAVLGLTAPATAQETPSLSRSLKETLQDPTTWAPAGITFTAKTLDWNSSQPIFAFGATEHSAQYTVSGLPDDRPLSPAAGHWRNVRYASEVAGVSFLHNTVSRVIQSRASRRWPTHPRLVRVLAHVERVAFAFGASYLASASNWRQWRTNQRVIAQCSAPGVTCVPVP